MLEPVKPLTTAGNRVPLAGLASKNCRAAWPPFIIFSAARWRTPSGFAVAPDVRRQDRLVPFVDQVAHRLADEMVGDGEAVRPWSARAPSAFCSNSLDSRAVSTSK